MVPKRLYNIKEAAKSPVCEMVAGCSSTSLILMPESREINPNSRIDNYKHKTIKNTTLKRFKAWRKRNGYSPVFLKS